MVDSDDWAGLINQNYDDEIFQLSDDKPIKTVGEAHISVEVDYQGFDPDKMAIIFGVENYRDEFGKHRLHNEVLWEYKVIGSYAGMFNRVYDKAPLNELAIHD